MCWQNGLGGINGVNDHEQQDDDSQRNTIVDRKMGEAYQMSLRMLSKA